MLEKKQHINDQQPYGSKRLFHLKKIFQKLVMLSELPQLDRWIAFELSQNKNFGSQDRKWYAEQIFRIVRNLYYSLYCLKYLNEIEKFEHEINTPKKFWDTVREFSFDAIYSHTKNNKIVDDAFLKANIPYWLKSLLMSRFSNQEDFYKFLILQQKRPALWIRLNHSDKLDDVVNDLKYNGFDVCVYQNRSSLAISGHKSVYQIESFKNGFFEVQDYASQEIGLACNIMPGECVWDVCAGGGGKTIQIASLLKQKGCVYATDIRAYKLDEIKRRAKRAQFFNIRTLSWDGKILPNFPKEVQNNKGFDCVLIDAPCSASGTWRRHPDAKYKVDIQSVHAISKIQLDILLTVHTAVKSNGRLVYATCSIFKEENEEVVNKFLENQSEFLLETMQIVSSPNDDSDFMFVAVMRKQK